MSDGNTQLVSLDLTESFVQRLLSLSPGQLRVEAKCLPAVGQGNMRALGSGTAEATRGRVGVAGS